MLQTVVLAGLVLMYFLAGLNKIRSFNNVAKGFTKKLKFLVNLPMILSQFVIAVVIILEVVAPICVVLGSYNKKYRRCAIISAYALAAFTVLATLLYHFPTDEDQQMKFLSNLTSICGLMLVGMYLSKN